MNFISILCQVSLFVSDPGVKLRQKTQFKTYLRQRQGLVPWVFFQLYVMYEVRSPLVTLELG